MVNRLKTIIKKILQQFSPFSHKHLIIVNSIPKSGTNLMLNIVKSIPYTLHVGDFSYTANYVGKQEKLDYIKSSFKNAKVGNIIGGHTPYFKEFANYISKTNTKQIFIYRNPRDYTVSLYHYVMKEKTPLHAHYDLWNSFKNDYNRLLHAIQGYGNGQKSYDVSETSIANVGIVYREHLKWFDDPNTLCISFEEIISIKNDTEAKIKFIDKILKFLSITKKVSDKRKEKIFNEGIDPSKSHTFRKGKSEAWKDEYSQEHIKIFNEMFDKKMLLKYGYNYNDI